MQKKVFGLLLGVCSICFSPGDLFAQIKVEHNSTTANPQILLRETEADDARISFENTGVAGSRWVMEGMVNANVNSSLLNFRYESNMGGSNRFTILGNGRIGVGNTNPDEDLVIGSNFGSAWAVPAITVGNINGGAIQLGSSENFNLSIESSNSVLGSKLTSNASGSTGILGIQATGVGIGSVNTNPGGYALKVAPTNLGMGIASQDNSEEWELFTTNAGDLQLYHGFDLRGTFNGTTGAYVANSDRRLKQGIKRLELILDRVMDLQVKRYTYKNADKRGRESIGFIAQEVEELFPELVYQQEGERNHGIYGINYSGLGPIAIKAIQELKLELDEKSEVVEQLEDEMAQKDQQIDALHTRLARIEKLLEEGASAQNKLALVPAPEIERAALKQNVPNPFEAITTISYQVPEKAQHVQLRISDPSGKVLRRMEIQQRGQVQTILDAQAMPAGTYLYSLWVDGELMGTKQMVLSH